MWYKSIYKKKKKYCKGNTQDLKVSPFSVTMTENAKDSSRVFDWYLVVNK